MFESLSENLGKIFDKLTKRGFLSEDDINTAMREVRIALLEADVSLSVIKDFINNVKEAIVGEEIVKSISPGQMVIKLVQDHLTKILGSESSFLNLSSTPPAIIMMVGLQGSGKTTTTAKIANFIKSKSNKKILLASLDVARPAAQEQLAILANNINVSSLNIIPNETPKAIALRAEKTAKLENYDILFLDTAGRLHIDESLMQELEEIKKTTNPIEILLVADAMTGQDAVNIAKNFNDKLNVTGIILTRMDGDSRGGAALSLKSVTGAPIKFLGNGERLSDLEEFHPSRIASRILGMGDIVSLVEKAASIVDQEEAEKMNKKIQKGNFDLDDLANQFKNIKKMGGIGSMLSMLPGLGKIKNQLDEKGFDEKILKRKEAIISSMTRFERKNPKILNASRKRRIANGAGVLVQDVNRLLKEYQDMHNVIKKFGKMDKKSLLRSGFGKLFS
ncbi:MAG: signal recognition particle protein [Alphaproteobacteria bacterium]